MIDELLTQLDKLHTTPMGVERICRNLALNDKDVVAWCKQKILTAEDIVRKGKNWYIYNFDSIITINAHSFTIITAHPNKKE